MLNYLKLPFTMTPAGLIYMVQLGFTEWNSKQLEQASRQGRVDWIRESPPSNATPLSSVPMASERGDSSWWRPRKLRHQPWALG